MRVLVTDGMDPTALATLRKAHEVDVRELDAKGLLAAIPTYHGLVVRSRTKVSKEVLSRGTQLKVIGRAGVGVDNIDVEEATGRRIVVVNAPTASTVGVAELAIGHMVSLLRHLPEADLSVRSGRWERARFEGRELFGKTLGLLGSGRIGAEVAKRAQAFGMQVISHDPYLAPEVADGIGVRLVTKDQLFRDADVLSIHAALTSETRGLVGPAQLTKMKRHAILVNCARGEIVDEGALAEALRSGTIAGAAIDVYAKEPPVGSPLLTAPNVVFTPHLGASTAEAQGRAGAIVVEQVMKVLAGERPEFLVNHAVYD
jgi:D-3-phosphoglycerate dehydrogenase / 2-oxoglutarate reductase